MNSTRKIIFPEDHPVARLDSYLAEYLPDISRSQLKKIIDNGSVTLEGAPVKASQKLKGGESLEVVIPEPEPTKALPENIPLNICYEDQDVIVINKPAGMVVHPAAGHWHGTLVNALLYHCDDLAGIGGELRPGIVHRIDKDTSGLLVVSKNDLSHQSLAEQFKHHSVQRRYLALIHGCPAGKRGTIDQAIGRHPIQRKKMSGKARHSKAAVTHWTVKKHFSQYNLSLIELQLETGRTHQIRVHMAEMNHPLVADPLYGNRSRTSAIQDPTLKTLIAKLSGQALHACLLGFIHPKTRKYLEFSCKMPETLSMIVNYLDKDPQID